MNKFRILLFLLLAAVLLPISVKADNVKNDLDKLSSLLTTIKQNSDLKIKIDSNLADVNTDLDELIGRVDELRSEVYWTELGQTAEGGLVKISETAGLAKNNVDALLTQLKALKSILDEVEQTDPIIDITVNDAATSIINGIISSLSQITSKSITVTTNYVSNGSPPSGGGGAGAWTAMEQATGNVGLAHAKGTLMGELGPELVVSNGRYFVAGQNGAEFVDLADDAIVFNHLQTESLFKHGMSKDRGRAVTNERNAIAFAQGNVNGGPAMASARAALAALKQLRAQLLIWARETLLAQVAPVEAEAEAAIRPRK